LERLVGIRAIYPNTGREGCWHRPLYESLHNDDRSLLDAMSEELRCSNVKPDVVFLSFERFFDLGRLHIQWLNESFPNLKVVIFLRRQDQLVNSYLNQMYKAHRVTIGEIKLFEASALNYNPLFDYQEMLERWEMVVGKENIRAVLFDKTKSSVDKFFEACEIDVDFEGYQEAFPNTAIDEYGLSVFRCVKTLIKNRRDLPEIIQQVHERLVDHFVCAKNNEENYLFTKKQRQKIMENYQSSNELVRKEFFPELECLFPPLEEGFTISPNYSQGLALAQNIMSNF